MTDYDSDSPAPGDIERLIDELLGVPPEKPFEADRQDWAESLHQCLNRHRCLRDANHLDPHAVLVYDRDTDTLERCELWQMPLRFPCGGAGAQWVESDLWRMVKQKAVAYRQSVVAHEVLEENPDASPSCATVVLVITNRVEEPFSWVVVKAPVVSTIP